MEHQNPREDELADFIREQLPEIDSLLAKQQLSLGSRPLHAAMHFVNRCIVNINGDTKDEFWRKPWFAILYWHVRNWYESLYGQRINNSSEQLPGAVFVNCTAFSLNIPVTQSKVEKAGELSWLEFPVEGDPVAPLESWFDGSPNFSGLPAREREQLHLNVLKIVAETRSLNLALMTAELDGEALQKLRGSILTHLGSATSAICANSPESWSVAMWELHLIVEKCIKLLLKQQRAQCPATHDLSELRKKASAVVDSSPIGSLCSTMLSQSKAIAFRYCEGEDISSEAIFEHYLSCLQIAVFYAENLSRAISIKNSRILLKKAPWLEPPDA